MRSNNNGSKAWIVVVVGMLMLVSATADAGSRSTGSMPAVASLTKGEASALRDARVSHVRHVLNERVEQVLSGARQKDFTTWANAKKGELAIVSMHGGAEALNLAAVRATPAALIPHGDSVFSRDKLDLDLIPVATLPGLYPGKPQHLIDTRPPNIMELIARSIRLGVNFTPIMATCLLAAAVPGFRDGTWYKWVANCLAASGPAFIKWGQWASTRSDMFPEALCQQLAQLHSAAPSHSWRHTQKMMESSLGLPRGTLLDVFESFDPKPLASGSIAQVHRAVLKTQDAHVGTVVAVKVRHPNVARLIDMDFRLMKMAATFADCIPALSWLHVRDSVEQFSHTMAAQAHLNVEGHHLEVLNHNFRRWNHVNFPRPIYASSSVIVETFEAGRIVTEVLDMYDALAKQQRIAGGNGTLTVEEVADEYGGTDAEGTQFIPMDIAKFIVTNGLALYLKMLLVDNLMHADLHVRLIAGSLLPAPSSLVECVSLHPVVTHKSCVHPSLETSCWT
jgi:ABC1 atypical kinase-like domain